VVHEQIVRDGVEPGGEARLRRIAAARLDYADPDLLEQLLGGGPVPDGAQHEAINRAPVTLVKRLEGPGVAPAIGEHELFIRGFHFS